MNSTKQPKRRTRSVGSLVAQKRKAKGWSQLQLATKIGLTSGAISLIETGKRAARVETLRKLAKALACPQILDLRKSA